MRFRWLAGLAFVAMVGAAAAQPVKGPAGGASLQQPPTWPSLQRFSGDAEFLQYVRTVRRLQEAEDRRRYHGAEADSVAGAAPPPPPPPPPAVTAAPAPAQAQASVSVPAGASVTNVQTQGVDEGDIVKQLGHFLIVLQDGRLFVVDTAPGGQPGLALTSRANVYRDARNQMWYDEMLVSGNRILVTGYSYRERASEITVFTINDAGQLHREAIYYLSSNDYYSAENYATRLVNGNLVIYTPLNIAYLNPDQPMRWPLIRRWLRDGERQAETTRGKPLFDAHDIYKPIRPTLAPFVHSVSVCPLGDPRSGDELDCRTTAFVGTAQREFFVSTGDIYLWVSAGWADRDCQDGRGAGATSATLYQVPLSGRSPRALFTRGVPTNQFALDANGGEFRALLGWDGCNSYSQHPRVRYFHAPLGTLSSTPRTAPDWSYVNEPNPDGAQYEPRFTESYLVYGSRPTWSSYPPQGQTVTGRVVAVPVSRPNSPVIVEAPHGVLRIERAGATNMALTGYHNDEGLSVSLLDLRGRPRIADTHLLEGRFESENRSHAFNSLIGPEGGLMGLPTVGGVKQSGRWVFRSESSDLSFLSVSAAGQLNDMGLLNSNDHAQDPSYHCEVSCIDWYGNSRAIFTGGRIFALSGTEMIEGGISGNRIGERRRLNLSAPPPRS
ncbi:MAG: beta-propeller domain-containing protein [Proteobacteria bacterium]|nr:beta-propeller domain-containing protein [Pseudomonadota bacterium]